MAADDDDARARAQALLDDAAPPGRRAPRVLRARAYAMHQVLVRTMFERRSLVWRFEPPRGEPASTAAAPTTPEFWAVAVPARAAGVSSRESYALVDERETVDCPPCSASGRARCEACGGAGWAMVLDPLLRSHDQQECRRCNGTGVSECRGCDGGGVTDATPVLVVETGTVLRARPVDDGALPTALVVQISGLELAGEKIHTESGLEVRPRATAGGSAYRGAPPRVSEPVDAAIDALLTEDPVGGDWRLRGRELEVARVPLFEVTLANGRDAWVCGTPARVLPDGVLTAGRWSGLLAALRARLGFGR